MISKENICMWVFFLKFNNKEKNNINNDKAAFVLTVCIHTEFRPFEFIWSFSIWLEALAILP